MSLPIGLAVAGVAFLAGTLTLLSRRHGYR
jgi:hypothetical protein